MSYTSKLLEAIGTDEEVSRRELIKFGIGSGLEIGTAPFILSFMCGCTEKEEESSVDLEDLGEPVDVVNGYVAKEGFGIPDVDEKLTGEGSLYALVEKEETDAKAILPEFGNYHEASIATYRDKDGNDVIMLSLDDEDPCEISGEQSRLIESYLIPEENIMPLIKKTKEGTYDCSELKRVTESMGWEYVDPIFKGSDANDCIIGNNKGKPEIFTGVIPIASTYGNFPAHEILIYNDAFMTECERLGGFGSYSTSTYLKEDKIKNFDWFEIIPVIRDGIKKLGEDLNANIMYIAGNEKELIRGTPDMKTGVHIRKKVA